MSDSTRAILHEVMEQQTLSIAKAGIICSLNARTSILAAANPRMSRWDEKLTVVENIQLPHTLMSRYGKKVLLGGTLPRYPVCPPPKYSHSNPRPPLCMTPTLIDCIYTNHTRALSSFIHYLLPPPGTHFHLLIPFSSTWYTHALSSTRSFFPPHGIVGSTLSFSCWTLRMSSLIVA